MQNHTEKNKPHLQNRERSTYFARRSVKRNDSK